MSYMHYCFGLAAQTVDPATLQEKEAIAYAIGSLDRLAAIRLPRYRKEVEDAIATRDGYYSQLNTAEEARQFLEAQRDFVEAYGTEEYSRMRQTIDASKRNADGSLNSIAANAAILSYMLARLPASK